MTASVINNSCSCGKFLEAAYDGVASACDQMGRGVKAVSKDLCDMTNMITHAKAMDAFISVKETFFGMETTASESMFKGSLKHLKGWNSVMTIADSALETASKVSAFVTNATVQRATDLVSGLTGLINKAYDVASFLENQIAVPFFNGISKAYESVHFQALALGSCARAAIAGERLVSYTFQTDLFEKGAVGTDAAVKNGLKLGESLAALSLAGSILTGAGSKAIVASSAIGAACKLSEYYWSNIL